MFWVSFWLWVGSSVLSALMAPRPKDAVAGSLGDITMPTAEDGRSISYLLGTCRVDGPNCVWWGDLRVDPIEKESGGFFGFFSTTVIVGYRYSLGWQLALCCGQVDELVDIEVGGKSLASYFGPLGGVDVRRLAAQYPDGARIHIGAPSLMGGEQMEGGVEGDLVFYFGSDTQPGSDYLARVWGSPAPGFRGVCHAVWECGYIGTQPYPKNWGWILRRNPCPPGMSTAHANINGDGNAACGIADILTLPREKGGLGRSASRLDWASFNAAAATLKAEGLGISLLLDREQDGDAWIGELLRLIDGVLYTDPSTGLYTLKLIRADYDPATLLVFEEDDFCSTPELQWTTWPETLNNIVIRYTDRSQGFTPRTVQDRDEANRAIRGQEAQTTIDYLGISNAATAQTIAAREKHTRAYPFSTLKGDLKRKAWQLRPGMPFKVVLPDFGLQGKIYRVNTIRYGSLEAGQIGVEATEDVFSSTSTSAYVAPTSGGWIDPVSAPHPAAAQALMEAPYWMVAENRHLLVMAARADATVQSMDIMMDDGGGYQFQGTLTTCTPTGTLAAAWSARTAAIDPTGFVVAAAGGCDLARLPGRSTTPDGRLRGNNLALVGSELVSWGSASLAGDGSLTVSGVMRGVADTVPVDHIAGERVWFLSQGCVLEPGANTTGGVGSQGPTGPGGPAGGTPTPEGVWDPLVIYEPLAIVERNGSSYMAKSQSIGQDPASSPSVWQLLAAKGDPGTSTFSRTTSSITIPALAAGASATAEIAIPSVSDLLVLTTNSPAWVRIYGTSSQRASDANRQITSDPPAGAGCYLDASLQAALPLSPVPVFVNGDSPLADVGYLTVKNLDTQTRDITVSLTYLPQEA